MPAAVVATLAVLLAAVAALARPRVAFTALLAATVLLPDTLALPNGVSALITVHLLVTVAALGGVLWRSATGRTPAEVWRPTAASLALAAYLLVAMVTGVVVASGAVSVTSALDRAVDLLQQLGVLVAATALVRQDGRPRGFLAPLAAVVLVSAGIGLVEHATGDSWGHFLFSRLPSQAGAPAGAPLQPRAGGLRVRAGADFALSYAWVLVALLPALLALAVRRGARVPAWAIASGFGVIAVLLAVYWSDTRSALLGLVTVALVAGCLSGRPRLAAVTILVLLAGVIAVVTLPAVGQHFSFGIDPGSIDVRQQRIPDILQAAAVRPFTGLGLHGLSLVGLSSVDSTYLLVYGETGALGLAALLAAFVVVVLAVARGMRARDADTRLLVATCLAGMLAVMASGVALDSVDLPSVIDVLWELAAVGLVAAEAALGPARLLRPVRTVAATAAAGAVVGGAVLLATPTQHAATFTFLTLPPAVEEAPGDPVTLGNTLIATACDTVTAESSRFPRLGFSCRNPYLAPGEGQLQVSGPSAAAVLAAGPALVAAVHRAGVPDFSLLTQQGPTVGRPSAVETLPASLALFAALVAATTPLGRRERALTRFRVRPPPARAAVPPPLPA